MPEAAQIDRICRKQAINPDHRTVLNDALRELVRTALVLQEQLDGRGFRLTTISELRAEVDSRIADVNGLIQWVRTLDHHLSYFSFPSKKWVPPEARTHLSKACAGNLSDAIDPWFVMKHFPLVPGHIPGYQFESESFTHEGRQRLVTHVVRLNPTRALELSLVAVLSTLKAFSAELVQVPPRVGPKPRIIEPIILRGLATLYERIGGRPSTKVGGKFHKFARAVVAELGQPVGWISSHLHQVRAQHLRKDN
jgi:hypothetical protein